MPGAEYVTHVTPVDGQGSTLELVVREYDMPIKVIGMDVREYDMPIKVIGMDGCVPSQYLSPHWSNQDARASAGLSTPVGDLWPPAPLVAHNLPSRGCQEAEQRPVRGIPLQPCSSEWEHA